MDMKTGLPTQPNTVQQNRETEHRSLLPHGWALKHHAHIVSYLHKTSTVSRGLTIPAWSRGEVVPPLTEELFSIDGCWKREKSLGLGTAIDRLLKPQGTLHTCAYEQH